MRRWRASNSAEEATSSRLMEILASVTGMAEGESACLVSTRSGGLTGGVWRQE